MKFGQKEHHPFILCGHAVFTFTDMHLSILDMHHSFFLPHCVLIFVINRNCWLPANSRNGNIFRLHELWQWCAKKNITRRLLFCLTRQTKKKKLSNEELYIIMIKINFVVAHVLVNAIYSIQNWLEICIKCFGFSRIADYPVSILCHQNGMPMSGSLVFRLFLQLNAFTCIRSPFVLCLILFNGVLRNPYFFYGLQCAHSLAISLRYLSEPQWQPT